MQITRRSLMTASVGATLMPMLPRLSRAQAANTIRIGVLNDQSGLYSFGRQPEAAFWNLQQLASCLTLVSDSEPLVEALNGFAGAYRTALMAAMLARLGLKSRGEEADLELVNAAFAALAGGGEALRWEPFFFDWFCGEEARALAGPRAALYQNEAFLQFRTQLSGYEADRPERLSDPYFARAEPEEMLYDEVEALWAPIDQADDWTAFEAKVAAVRRAGAAWRLDPLVILPAG